MKRVLLSSFKGGLMLFIGLAVLGCAQVRAPDGGPTDEQPPRVVPEKSTPNFQTNFQKQDIRLTFDEWVQLNDVFRQVVISPPLDQRPEFNLKGKTLVVEFAEEEVLRENATYTINFGEAVQDLTERNPAENLRFVFSTGEVIDSLDLAGQLLDAFTRKPVDEALFMLYEQTADSVVYTQRPFYFGRSDKTGNFSIANLRAGSFKGFALKDANLNYLYDQPNEMIGFPEGPVIISDSLSGRLEILVFVEDPPLKIIRVDSTRFGLLKLTFNQPAPIIAPGPDSLYNNWLIEAEKDTLFLWYDRLPSGARQTLFLQQGADFRDTLRFTPASRDSFLQRANLRSLRRPGKIQNPFADLTLGFNHPLAAFDTAAVILYQDSLGPLPGWSAGVDSTARRSWRFRYNWQEDSTYRLQLLPGAITDIFGLSLRDTLEFEFKVRPRKNFGTLNLSFINLPADSAYWVQLQLREKAVREFFFDQGGDLAFQIQGLEPGEYELVMVLDENKNRRWDPGNYDRQRQPESIIRRKVDPLRANWEVDFTVDFAGNAPLAPPTEPEEEE